MARPALMVALGLIVAADWCGVGSCRNEEQSCTSTTHNAEQKFELLPGASADLRDPTCSTCGHSGGRVTWTLLESGPYTGSVNAKFQASCSQNFLCCQADTATAAPDQGSTGIQFSEINAKNLCGENSNISYTMTITNNTNVRIQTDGFSVTCAYLPAAGNPSSVLAPSEVKR